MDAWTARMPEISPGTGQDQKALDPLELELQMFASHHVLEIAPSPLGEQVLKLRAKAPAHNTASSTLFAILLAYIRRE